MEPKICKECGKVFIPKNGMSKYCDDTHYRKCRVCGKSFIVPNSTLGSKESKQTCSRACAASLRRKTNTHKYGGPAPACSDQVRQQMEETMLDRYGIRHAAQAQMFKDKTVQTCLERYGVDHPSQTAESRSRLSAQWEDPNFRTNVQLKRLSTSIEKYGELYPMRADSIKTKCIQSKMRTGENLDNFLRFKQDPAEFLSELNLDHKPTIYELTSYLGVNESTVGQYVHKHSCEDLVEFQVSTMEQSVGKFIASILPEANVLYNVHSVITPYELDIYLPEYQLGIECNPTATHNSSLPDPWGNSPKSAKYHQMKTDACEKQGIRLIHIFGHEWTYKRDILESILRSALGVLPTRVYARDCVIREIDSKTCSQFLESNHRQGSANSKYRYGLFDQDELVATMTFSKMRPTIGTGNEDLDDCYELVRFCNRLNTTVVGGASKLFKHFIRDVNPGRIRSFSDRAHTTGELYRNLGFTEHHRSEPGYVWVDTTTDKAYSRINAQKQNISKFLRDDSIDLNKSESQIMTEHGFVRVFDSGTICWQRVRSCYKT